MNLWPFAKNGDNNSPAPAQAPAQATSAAKPAGPGIQGFFNKGNAMIQGAMQTTSQNGQGNGTLPSNAYKAYEQPAQENYAPKAYRVQPTGHEEHADPSEMAGNAIPHVPQPKLRPRAEADAPMPESLNGLFPDKVVMDPNEPLGNPEALDNLIRSVDELLYADGNGKTAPEPQSLDTMFAVTPEETYTPQPEAAYTAPAEAEIQPVAEETYTPQPEAAPDLNEFMAAHSLEFVSTAKTEAETPVYDQAPPYDTAAFAPPETQPETGAVPDPYATQDIASDFTDFVPQGPVEGFMPDSPAEEAAVAQPVAAVEHSAEGFADFDPESLLAELKASATTEAVVEAPPEPVAKTPKYTDADLMPPDVSPPAEATTYYPVPEASYAPPAPEAVYETPDVSYEAPEASYAPPVPEAVYETPDVNYETPEVSYAPPAPEVGYETPDVNYETPEASDAPAAGNFEAEYQEQPAYAPEPMSLTSYTAEGFDEQQPEAPEASYQPAYTPAYDASPEYEQSVADVAEPSYEAEAFIADADPGDENDYSDNSEHEADYETSQDEADYEDAPQDEAEYEEATTEEVADEYYAEPYDNPYSDYNVIDGQPKFVLDAEPAAVIPAAAPAPRRKPSPPPRNVYDFEARVILEESRFVKNSIDQLVDRYFSDYSPDAKHYNNS